MERLIERLMACGMTRAMARSLCCKFGTLYEFERFVESVEEEHAENGHLTWI